MNKKFLLLIAIFVLVTGLVACNDKKEETSSEGRIALETNTSESTPEVIEPELELDEVINTDPYVANIPNEILDFYLEKVEEIEANYKEEQDKILADNPDYDVSNAPQLKYDLVFFNDDNIPELVVNKDGYSLALYTYDAGKVIYAMKEEGMDDDESGWPYGAGGNHGYEYAPRKNVLRNLNADHAGLIVYYYLASIDPETHLLVSKYDKELYVNNFDDKNNNGSLDEDEMENYVENASFVYDGKAITEEEFSEYIMSDYEFVNLTGTKSYEDIKVALTGLINEK